MLLHSPVGDRNLLGGQGTIFSLVSHVFTFDFSNFNARRTRDFKSFGTDREQYTFVTRNMLQKDTKQKKKINRPLNQFEVYIFVYRLKMAKIVH